jgi:ArsR family transcriptional regulator
MKYNYAEYVPMLKALTDETRLKIIDMLSCGQMCACEILKRFDITQPTLSYHMKILTESQIVIGKRDGAWINYSLNNDRNNELRSFLDNLMSDTDDCICYDNNNKNGVK